MPTAQRRIFWVRCGGQQPCSGTLWSNAWNKANASNPPNRPYFLDFDPKQNVVNGIISNAYSHSVSTFSCAQQTAVQAPIHMAIDWKLPPKRTLGPCFRFIFLNQGKKTRDCSHLSYNSRLIIFQKQRIRCKRLTLMLIMLLLTYCVLFVFVFGEGADMIPNARAARWRECIRLKLFQK